MIFQEYLDCPPSDFFDGVDTGYLLESFAKKHMTYTVSQHNIYYYCYVHMQEPQEILLGEPYYSQTKFGTKRSRLKRSFITFLCLKHWKNS